MEYSLKDIVDNMKELVDRTNGRIVVLQYAFASLIAMHPEKEKLVQLIKGMMTYPIEETASEIYRRGMQDVVDTLDEVILTAVLAEQEGRKGPGGTA